MGTSESGSGHARIYDNYLELIDGDTPRLLFLHAPWLHDTHD